MTSAEHHGPDRRDAAADASWPVDLGIAIGVQAALEDSDAEGLLSGTVPRPAATEEAVADFEHALGEPLPAELRGFLLHANGWPGAYFTMDVFGLPELGGEGQAAHAKELLETYEAEDVLEDSDIAASDVLPVAAGQGNDLVVIIRAGRPDAGSVIWFDGEEYGRYPTFRAFFQEIVAMLQDYVENQ